MFYFRECDTETAIDNCRQALGDDAQIIADQLRRGVARADICEEGTAITKFDPVAWELVIVAYEGINGREFFDHACKFGRSLGAKSVRFHSNRKGAKKYIGPLADEVETIFRKRL